LQLFGDRAIATVTGGEAMKISKMYAALFVSLILLGSSCAPISYAPANTADDRIAWRDYNC
jgi:hypothetical protein